MHLWSIFIIFLLNKIELVKSNINPLMYFQLESMLNYDIQIYTDISKGIYIENFIPGALQSILVVESIYFPRKGTFTQHGKNEDNAIVIISPLNVSESYSFLNNIITTYVTCEIKNRQFFFLIWPYELKTYSADNIISILTNLTTSNFTLDTNIFVIFTTINLKYLLWEIYSIKNKIFINAVKISSERIDISDILEKSSRRKDFKGIEIIAVATFDKIYDAETKFSNKTGVLTLESGFATNLYRDLKDMLNFSESAIPGNWLSIVNATLEGSQAIALVTEKADICISQNVMRAEIAAHLTFLQPSYTLSVFAFFEEPSFGSLVEIYNQPFSTSVWILLGVFLIIFSVLINIFVKTLYTSANLNKTDKNLETILWTVGTACQQGWHTYPDTLPLRVLFITGSLTAVVVYGAYSAALVSKLSVQLSPIQSFSDLLNYNYKFIFNVDSVSLREYTRGMRSYYKIQTLLSFNKAELCKQTMKPQTVLLSYWDGIQESYLVMNEIHFICESLQTLKVENTVIPSGMTLKKGSPYKEIFNQKILQIKERGFNHRYAQDYNWATQPQCVKKSKVREEHLDLKSMFSAHLILLAGFLGGSIVFIFEFQLSKRSSVSTHKSTLTYRT